MKTFLSIILLLSILKTWALPAQALELAGDLSVEGRLFAKDELYDDQKRDNGSIAMEPEFYHEWPSSPSFSFTFVPFFRLDSADSDRTHFDIRELNFLVVGNPWELRVGIGKVFWGVTEFVHLVDIINQTDQVENIDGEDKLGQPMVHFSYPGNWGVLDFFLLPYFREHTYPGREGRLRPPIVVDTDNPQYESGAEEYHLDLAMRYSQTFGWGDMGIYYFRGTSRDPILVPSLNKKDQPLLLPFYDQIDQVGLDLQLVLGNWLWKLESLYRDETDDDFWAATGGFEYTFVSIADTMVDLGLITEYSYDDREDDATTPFQNDLLFGLRLGVNDAASTELLAGISVDLDESGHVLQIEASRRLTDNLKLFLEAWSFFDLEENQTYLYSIRDDDFVRMQLFYYF
jgi:hypothetical protein